MEMELVLSGNAATPFSLFAEEYILYSLQILTNFESNGRLGVDWISGQSVLNKERKTYESQI